MGCTGAVNVRLLPVKASYFFTLAGIASLLPYLAVYMKQAGLSPSETAIIYGTMPFVGAFTRPLIGMVADKLGKHKAVLMGCCVLTGLLHACLLSVPHHPLYNEPASVRVNISCMDAGSRLTFCPQSVLSSLDCIHADMKNANRTVFYHHPNNKFPDPLVNSTDCNLHCRSDFNNKLDHVCFKGKETKNLTCPKLHSNGGKEGFANVHEGAHVPVNKAYPILFDIKKLEYISQSIEHTTTVLDDQHVCHNYQLADFAYRNDSYEDVVCDRQAVLHCVMQCSNLPTKDYVQSSLGLECSEPVAGRYGSIFWTFFLIYLLGQIAFAPIIGLIDAMTYDFLGEARGAWGQQRLWGTVGFAIFAVVSGLLMDLFEGRSGEKDYTAAFVMFSLHNVLAAFCVCFYRVSRDLKCGNLFHNVKEVLVVPEVVVLLALVFWFGIYQGVIETFLYWHLETLGSSQLIMGLSMLMATIPEVLVLFFAGLIISKFGQTAVMCVVCVASFIRLVSYCFLVNPWWVLAIEPLHAVTFGLMYAAASSYGAVIAPAGMHGTIQGLIGGVYFGIGKGVGSVTGGLVFERFGPTVMFRSYGISALIVLLVYILTVVVLRRHNRQSRKLPTKEAPAVITGGPNGVSEPKITEMRRMNGDEDGLESDDTDALVANDPLA